MEIRYYGDKISERIAKTPEGFLICQDVPISRTGFQKYLASELYDGPLHHDRIVPVYRPAKEVFDPRSLASFEGKPVTNEHPEEDVTPDNYARYACGHVQNVHIGEGEDAGKVLADLYITDPALIQLIKTGKREVSCGYYAEEKKDPEGRICQTKIRGNHVAVVDNGRAGNKVCIRDSNPFMRGRNKMRSRFRNYRDALRYIDADDIMDEDVLYDEDIVEDEDYLADDDYLEDDEEILEDDDYLEDDDILEDDDYLTDEDFEDEDILEDDDYLEDDDDILEDEDFEDDDYLTDDDYLMDEDFITDAGVKGMKKGQHVKAKDPDYLRAVKMGGAALGTAAAAGAAAYGFHKLGGVKGAKALGGAIKRSAPTAFGAAKGFAKNIGSSITSGVKSIPGRLSNAALSAKISAAGAKNYVKRSGGVGKAALNKFAENTPRAAKAVKTGIGGIKTGASRVKKAASNAYLEGRTAPGGIGSRIKSIGGGIKRGLKGQDSMFGMRRRSLPYYDEDTLYDEDVILDDDILEDDDYLMDEEILEDEDYLTDDDYLTDEDEILEDDDYLTDDDEILEDDDYLEDDDEILEDDDYLEDDEFEDEDIVEDDDILEDEDIVEDDDYLTDEDELTLRADALLQDAKRTLKKAQKKLRKAKKSVKRRKRDAEILNDDDYLDEDFEDEDYLVDEDYEDEDFEDENIVEDDDYLTDDDILEDDDVIEDEEFEDEDIVEDEDYVEDACLRDDESDTISIDKTKALRELSEASREISDPSERKQVQDTIYKTLCNRNQMTDVMNITKRNRARRDAACNTGMCVSFEQQQSIYDSFNPHKNKSI